MNKVILIGRLTKDPEVRNTQGQTAYCNFTIAVDRRFKDQNGQRTADFINFIAWRQTATFLGSYFRKGSKVAVVGSIQTRTYDDNQGQKRYVTEVVVDEVEFADSSNSAQRDQAPNNNYSAPQPQQQPQQTYQAPVQNQAPVAPAPAPAPAPAAAPQAPQAPTTQIEPTVDPSFEIMDDNGELPFDV